MLWFPEVLFLHVDGSHHVEARGRETWQYGSKVARRGPEKESETLGGDEAVGKMKQAADISTASIRILMQIGLRCVHQWLKEYDEGLRQSEILRLITQFPELLR